MDGLVAPGEAVGVVEGLKVIEVDIDQGEGHRLRKLALQLGLKQQVAGQASKRVTHGELVGAAQVAADAGQQHVDIVGLHNIIVGARVEAYHHLGRGATGGEDDHRQVRGACIVAQLADRLKAVHQRHHEVDQQQVGGVILGKSNQLVAVASDQYLIAGIHEGLTEKQTEGRVVVGHQDACLRCHRPPRLNVGVCRCRQNNHR